MPKKVSLSGILLIVRDCCEVVSEDSYFTVNFTFYLSLNPTVMVFGALSTNQRHEVDESQGVVKAILKLNFYKLAPHTY